MTVVILWKGGGDDSGEYNGTGSFVMSDFGESKRDADLQSRLK